MAFLLVFRPFAVALALFVVLNAGASVARPSLGAARLLINLPIPEPYLSLGLLLFGFVMLFPPRLPVLQSAAIGVLVSVALIIAANIIRYYTLLARGLIQSSLPVPFSALILAVVVAEALRLYLTPASTLRPGWLQVLCVPPAFMLLCAAHIVTFGTTDYRYLGRADAVVVLGARVNADWSLSPSLRSRMLTGIELLKQGRVSYLIVSGGTGLSGVNEAEAMKRFAVSEGVAAERVVMDPKGVNTFASAVNCAALFRRYGWRRVMIVSQYYHLARAKLIFERQGLSVLTVPARPGGRIRTSLYYLVREAVALPYYYLCYTFEKTPP